MVDLKNTNERLQEELQRNHVLLNAINDAQSHFITDSDEGILFDGLLKNLRQCPKLRYLI